jgi:pyruvate decarboxylase
MTHTIGCYLAARFSQIGLKRHFAVAGDYNLALLDQLLTNKDLTQVYCSNELNGGFSAEGYARANGAGRNNALPSCSIVAAAGRCRPPCAHSFPVPWHISDGPPQAP